jgi:hypothetical protein
MDYFKNNILSSQNQVQLVEEAIPTLCDRLQHATLSNDRRAAVLGLKSFSREYRESVAQHGLRALISTFRKDFENPVIIKAVLETLLILFIRGGTDEDLTRGWISQQSRLQNGKYPSPALMKQDLIDEVSMWIADALTQDQTVLQLFIDLLQETTNFHIKLYTLQLLEALVSARPTMKLDLLGVPTSISVIVSLLNDDNEPVRNEAILILMALANNNSQIQKLVAFENTFDRLFDIIEEEGGIRGSILVQDCLTLITNLLQYNAINQKLFLETNIVPRLQSLISEPVTEEFAEDENDPEGFTRVSEPIVWTEQRVQNMSIALEICKTLVTEDNSLISENQIKLADAGLLFTVLKLAFSPITTNEIKETSLITTGNLIIGNSDLQLKFSQIDVPYMDPSMPNQLRPYDRPIPIAIALLNWALFINSVHCFGIRSGAAYCLKCYFKDNKESKLAFLNDQIKAYNDPNFFLQENQESSDGNEHVPANDSIPMDDTIPPPFANIFSTLMDYDSSIKLNPYRAWFAALILLYLFDEEHENRELARGVKTGDEESGEEVMNSIQAISGLLVASFDSYDQRVGIGYLMLLTVWMYEDLNAVNDFLSDPSVVRSVITFVSDSSKLAILLQGMAAIVLGIAYEFSSNESPIPRQKLHKLLTETLGKDNYVLKVKQFKSLDHFKNFDEDLSYTKTEEIGLPNVFFDALYVNLIKDNFNRIKRALFHDPMVEPLQSITFEAFEELDGKLLEIKTQLLDEKTKARENEKSFKEEIKNLKDSEDELSSKLLDTTASLNELKEKHVKISETYETTKKDLEVIQKAKKEFESSSQSYWKELQEITKDASTTKETLKSLELRLESTESAKSKLEDGINNMTRDLFQLKKTKEGS